MPKPVNPAIGTCPCSTPGCDSTAKVKKQRSGSPRLLYLDCPECGVIMYKGQQLQEYIVENATIEGAPALEPATADDPTEPGQGADQGATAAAKGADPGKAPGRERGAPRARETDDGITIL